MPLYLTKFSYTPAAWAKLIKNPEDRRAAVCRRIERHHPEAGADQIRCERAELRAATVPAVHHQHHWPRAPGISRQRLATMDHGQRLGRAAPFLLLRRFRKTQRLKPQAIHPAPGQGRRDQAKQANGQAQHPEGYRHGQGTEWGWLFMIAPCGREVGNLPVQN